MNATTTTTKTGDELGALDWKAARDQGIQLLEKRDYGRATTFFEHAAEDDPSGECYAMLGLTYFHLEQYDAAAENYRHALQREPRQADWQEMLAKASTNAHTKVGVRVPAVQYFDCGELLSPANVPDSKLPSPPSKGPPSHIVVRLTTTLRTWLGNFAGRLISILAHIGTWVVGRLGGYRDAIWTNWYRRPLYLAILTMAYMREELHKHNLKDTYPAGKLTAFHSKSQTPPDGVTHYRTADGSWNNLENPKEGAAYTRFARNVNSDAIRPETGEQLMTPNPREVSRTLLTREERTKEVPFLNLLAASWIQFQNHDWVSHGENRDWPHVHEIPLANDDPARRKYRQTKMFVGKTQDDPTRSNEGEETPVTYINEVTHWWDGSQIYGSDWETADRLRSHVDGKLRLTDSGTLPIGENGVEETGFVRNWWIGLSMLHTLFVKEHNVICDRLKLKYPHWDDNRLYDVARLVNAAVMAKIHTVEWTPAILPNEAAVVGLNSNWYGIFTYRLRSGKDRKARAWLNVRHPETGGVVGNPMDKHGSPYALTEEFVEVYRLHSLLPEVLRIKKMDDSDPAAVDETPLDRTRQAASKEIVNDVGMANLFYSFGSQHPGQLVLNNFPRFMQEMSIPGNPLFDMGAVDILRARERGVPRYNEFRRQLGLAPIKQFEDLTDDPAQVDKLKQVYGNKPEDVEKLDLLIGTLGEGHRPTNFGFGETLFQIFMLNATRRLQADRFYTENYNEETYTKEGLDWIDDTDFKTVLLRHYPELANTGLANVRNAFEPWDTDEVLDLSRHPLRKVDKDIKHEPSRGDAYR